MENQRTEYIQAKNMNEQKTDKVNEMAYERSFTTRGTLELKVPRTRDGHFSPTVFERYQRNEKPSWLQCWKCMYQAVSTRKVSKIVEELWVKSVSKSFVSSLTEQLEPMVNEWQNRLLSEKLSLLNDRCTLYKSTRRKSKYSQKLSYSDWNNQRWRP